MRLIPNDVATLAMGLAASMGQFLLCAGTPGKRFALPHARILMHQPSAGIGGTAVDIAIQAENLEHAKRDDAGPDRRAHRSAGRDDRAGQRPRPLVHRRAGPRLRVRRPGGRATSDDVRPDAGRGRWGCDGRPVHDPDGRRADARAGSALSTSSAACCRERIIFLGTEIDDGVANVVIAQLLHLQSESADADISLYINSPGGSLHLADGDLRHDAVRPARRVRPSAWGRRRRPRRCCWRPGAPGKRYVLEHARVLLHQPSGGGEGTAADLEMQAQEILRIREQVEQVLTRHTGHDVERLRADTDRDLILTAQEAVAYGLADGVVRPLAPV